MNKVGVLKGYTSKGIEYLLVKHITPTYTLSMFQDDRIKILEDLKTNYNYSKFEIDLIPVNRFEKMFNVILV